MTESTISDPTKPQNSPSAFEALISFFKKNSWPYFQHETQPILRVGYQGESGEWSCIATTQEKPSQFVFYSLFPIHIPPQKRLEIAELLAKVNYGLIVGNFEIDFQDGELRYKTYAINLEAYPQSLELIGQLIFVNVMTMDKYFPGIMSVIYADLTVDQAIKKVEETSESNIE